MKSVRVLLFCALSLFSSLCFSKMNTVDSVFGIPFGEEIIAENYPLRADVHSKSIYYIVGVDADMVSDVQVILNKNKVVSQMRIRIRDQKPEIGHKKFDELKEIMLDKYDGKVSLEEESTGYKAIIETNNATITLVSKNTYMNVKISVFYELKDFNSFVKRNF